MPSKSKTSNKEKKSPIERFCTYCGKSSNERYRMIAGPKDTFICDECVSVCVTIFSTEGGFYLPPVISKTVALVELLDPKRFISSPPTKGSKSLDVLFLAPQTDFYDIVYNEQVKPLATKYKISIKNSRQLYSPNLSKVINAINKSFLVIADITDKDPDVMFLLGIIHYLEKPSIVLTQNFDNIPHYIFNTRHIYYENNPKSSFPISNISKHLESVFEHLQKFNDIIKLKKGVKYDTNIRLVNKPKEQHT